MKYVDYKSYCRMKCFSQEQNFDTGSALNEWIEGNLKSSCESQQESDDLQREYGGYHGSEEAANARDAAWLANMERSARQILSPGTEDTETIKKFVKGDKLNVTPQTCKDAGFRK